MAAKPICPELHPERLTEIEPLAHGPEVRRGILHTINVNAHGTLSGYVEHKPDDPSGVLRA
jgi:hypothetical protein